MKKAIVFALMFAASAQAQNAVRLVVTDVATRQGDAIYVAGNFNNWNPKDEQYRLKPFGGGRQGVVIKDIPSGTYAFKFTRGSFERVECAADGRDIADRTLEVNGDAVLECKIVGWKDDYPEHPKRYTASPQVRIMDTAFAIPQLNRTRRIWVYLPKGYAASSKTYPVLYMEDGQNLFNEQTAFAEEWGVDEALDSMQRTGKECIVVGIDNGGAHRMNEYDPYDQDKYGKGEGIQYVDFLVHTLKPYIDGKYKTKKGPEYTYTAGSSMGGLISLYAIMQYPQVFGGAGVFSPSLWIAPQMFDEAAKFRTVSPVKIYFYAGSKESATMVSDMEKMEDLLSKRSNIQILSTVFPLGQHNEKYWRQAFPAFYQFIVE